ncbi:MAG: replication factor C small subunit [Candidatus Kariarchaeaceae archaeon]
MSYGMMWSEKYRPKRIDDLMGQTETKSRLKGFIKSKSLPHLLFAGPPGTGKTSAVIVLAIEIFGESGLSRNLLELNASDERGIDVIRNTVKDFARTIPSDNAPFKIISLDEADALTPAAQHALRRTMERYVSSSRFVLLCNYPGKIIEPIQSRCAFFRFNGLREKEIAESITNIATAENVDFVKAGIDTIVEVCGGDLRKAINILQATAAIGGKINKKAVYNTIGGVDPSEIRNLVQLAKDQDFVAAQKRLQDLVFVKGISGGDIIREISREIPNLKLTKSSQLQLISLLAETDFRLTEGASPDIQLAAVLAMLGTLEYTAN